jgi:hypothetical protein
MFQLCFHLNKIHDSVGKALRTANQGNLASRGLWSRFFRNGRAQITLACEVANQGRSRELSRALNLVSSAFQGPHTPDAIRQRDAIFRFSLTDNFDPSLNFPNI